MPIARKCLLTIKGISSSYSMPSTMKSAKNINLFIFTNMSSMTHLRCLIDLSVNYKETMMGFGSLSLNFLKIEIGIRLILDPKSHNGLA